MVVYVALEALCAASRVVFLHININLSIKSYLINVFAVIAFIAIVNSLICYLLTQYLYGWRILFVFFNSAIITGLLTCVIGLKPDEKSVLLGVINKIKFKRKQDI